MNKRQGPVKYHEVNVDIACGYVENSVVLIYTSQYAHDMLNIVHVHINDMSEEVTLEVRYMGDGETLALYQDFKEDHTGRPLRYKVIVKD